jgi:hypothetical protein
MMHHDNLPCPCALGLAAEGHGAGRLPEVSDDGDGPQECT